MTDRTPQFADLYRQIHETVSAIIDGSVTVEQAQAFSELLSGDPEARRLYFEYIRETNLMRDWAAQPPADNFFTFDVDVTAVRELLELAEEQERSARQAEAESRRQQTYRKSRREPGASYKTSDFQPTRIIEIPMFVVYGVAAAVIALAAFGVHSLIEKRLREAPQVSEQKDAPRAKLKPPVAVATLTRTFETTEIQYIENVALPKPRRLEPAKGLRLYPGRYSIACGVVEVSHDDGASTVLEGPATFDIHSAARLRLESGKAVSHVPQEAVGFCVDVPTGSIVDLGTEFALSVNQLASTDVHVIDGKVELQPGGAPELDGPQPAAAGTSQVLAEGQARKLTAADGSIEEIRFDCSGFVRSLNGLYARDRFDSDASALLLSAYRGGLGLQGRWERSALHFRELAEIEVADGEARSKGSGDVAYFRLLKHPLEGSAPVYFSAEVRINGADPISSVWLELFHYSQQTTDHGELEPALIGITDGRFTARLRDASSDQAKKQGAFGNYESGRKHLIVGKLEFDAVGNQERLATWIDPDPNAEPGVPDKIVVGELGYSTIDAVAVRFWDMEDGDSQGFADSIRVTTKWSAVQ